MNISQTIRPWGNSVGIRLPKAVTEKAGVRAGQKLDISLRNGSIVLTPVAASGQTLDSLLAGITADNLHSAIEVEEPKGNEEW